MRKNKKILIVDDDPDVRDTIRAYLDEKGFIIEEACDGQEALKTLKKERPDLIILDILMPVMDGFELLKLLKTHARYSKIPVIVLSVKSDPVHIDKGVNLEADIYLPKPFTFVNLMNFINLLL